jgi:ubiquinone/menaquinone biosynthesis C-methylase UbiE
MSETAYTRMSYADIAASYNKLNAIPEDALREIGASVAALVSGMLLDMGAGAGRITRPIADAGVPAIALDNEYAMLHVSTAGSSPGTLYHVQGDVVHLPFGDDRFGAVFTSNVLHLVAEWQDALHEASRVLQPDGLLIIGRDVLDPESCAGKLRNKLRQVVGTLDPSMQPTGAAGPGLIQTIGKLGGKPGRPVVAAEWTQAISPAQLLQRMRTRRQNETWALNDDLLSATMKDLDAYAANTFAEPDRVEAVHWSFQLMPIHGFGASSG